MPLDFFQHTVDYLLPFLLLAPAAVFPNMPVSGVPNPVDVGDTVPNSPVAPIATG